MALDSTDNGGEIPPLRRDATPIERHLAQTSEGVPFDDDLSDAGPLGDSPPEAEAADPSAEPSAEEQAVAEAKAAGRRYVPGSKNKPWGKSTENNAIQAALTYFARKNIVAKRGVDFEVYSETLTDHEGQPGTFWGFRVIEKPAPRGALPPVAVRPKLMVALLSAYDTEARLYRPGQSDLSVAAELDLDESAVAAFRVENFGEMATPPGPSAAELLDRLFEEIASTQNAVSEMLELAEMLKARIGR